MDLIKIKQQQKLLHSKGQHKHNERTTHRMGDNILKDASNQALIPKCINSSCSSVYKTNNPNKTSTEDLNRHFSKQNIQVAKRHKKRFSTHESLKKSKLKPQRDIISHWLKWPSSKSLQTINAGEGVSSVQFIQSVMSDSL